MTLEALMSRRIGRCHRQFTADRLSAELGCEVTPHPVLPDVYEAREPAPGVWVLVGSPDAIRDEAARSRAEWRREQMIGWLRSRGFLGGAS